MISNKMKEKKKRSGDFEIKYQGDLRENTWDIQSGPF